MIVGEICIATNKVYTIMNYLAHLYLSGESDEIKLGNFIGDYVKGNKHQKFPDQVAFGIKLHRRIDSFTDHHPDVNECKQILTSGYGRYSGVVVDIFFFKTSTCIVLVKLFDASSSSKAIFTFSDS